MVKIRLLEIKKDEICHGLLNWKDIKLKIIKTSKLSDRKIQKKNEPSQHNVRF